MRASFGAEVRLAPVPSFRKPPRSFRVHDGKGHHLESFGVFGPEQANEHGRKRVLNRNLRPNRSEGVLDCRQNLAEDETLVNTPS
jgi:hypothetical protein